MAPADCTHHVGAADVVEPAGHLAFATRPDVVLKLEGVASQATLLSLGQCSRAVPGPTPPASSFLSDRNPAAHSRAIGARLHTRSVSITQVGAGGASHMAPQHFRMPAETGPLQQCVGHVVSEARIPGPGNEGCRP